jgi:hypothetical protein
MIRRKESDRTSNKQTIEANSAEIESKEMETGELKAQWIDKVITEEDESEAWFDVRL